MIEKCENWQLESIAKTIYFIENIPIQILNNNQEFVAGFKPKEKISFDKSEGDNDPCDKKFEYNEFTIVVGPVSIAPHLFLGDYNDSKADINTSFISQCMFDDSYIVIKNIFAIHAKFESTNINILQSSSILEQYLVMVHFVAKYKHLISGTLSLKIDPNTYKNYQEYTKVEGYCFEITENHIQIQETTISGDEKFILEGEGVKNLKQLRLKLTQIISLKKQRSKVYSRRQLNECMAEVNNHIGGIPSEDFYTKLCERILRITGLEYAILYSYDTLDEKLKTLASTNEKYPKIDNLSSDDKEQSISYTALTTENPQVLYAIEDKKSYPENVKVYQQVGQNKIMIRGVVAVPIVFKGRSIGILEISTTNNWQVNSSHIRKATSIAQIISYALYRTRYLQALQQIQQAVNSHNNGDNIYNDITTQLCHIFLAKKCLLFKHQIDGNYYENVTNNNFKTNHIDCNGSPIFGEFLQSDKCYKSYTQTDVNILDIQKELGANFTSVEQIVLVKAQNDTQHLGVLLLYFTQNIDFDNNWKHILEYISLHIYTVLKSINDIDSINNPIKDSMAHSLAYDGDKLVHLANKITNGYKYLDKDIALLQYVFNNKHIEKNIKNTLDYFAYKGFEEAKTGLQSIKASLILAPKDMLAIATTIQNRTSIKGYKDLNPENKLLLRKLRMQIGDRGVINKIMLHQTQENCSLRGITQNIITPFLPDIQTKGCFIDNSQVHGNIAVYSNHYLLQDIIITNLIINAIKYSNRDSVITISTQIKNNKLQFIIHNEGKYLTPKERYKIFNKNFRGSNVTSHQNTLMQDSSLENKGLGIGLFEVDKLIRHSRVLNITSLQHEIKNAKNNSKCEYNFILEFKEYSNI